MSLIDGLVGAILVATVLSSMWVFLIPMITTVLLTSVVGLSLFGIVRNFLQHLFCSDEPNAPVIS